MKAIQAWILVAVLGLTVIIGHEMASDYRAREVFKAEASWFCSPEVTVRETLSCGMRKDEAARAALPRTIFYFYIPLTGLFLAAIYAIRVNRTAAVKAPESQAETSATS